MNEAQEEEAGLLPQRLIKFHSVEKDQEGYSRFCKFCLHSKVGTLTAA